jgi:hypothetical protein
MLQNYRTLNPKLKVYVAQLEEKYVVKLENST